MKICLNAKHFWFLFWYWKLDFSCSYKKVSIYTIKCTKECGNSLSNAPWHLGHSEKNYQAAEEKSYPGEIEL